MGRLASSLNYWIFYPFFKFINRVFIITPNTEKKKKIKRITLTFLFKILAFVISTKPASRNNTIMSATALSKHNFKTHMNIFYWFSYKGLNFHQSEHLKTILRDLKGEFEPYHSDKEHLKEALQWLLRAQQATSDAGFSAGYTFFHDWLPSYPETTGYIIQTLWDAYQMLKDEALKISALQAADWLINIRLENGATRAGFYGEDRSRFWSDTIVPAAFNTGQVILGWNQTFLETQEERYLNASIKASHYLTECISEEGIFEKGLSPGPTSTLRSYYTRVAFALIWTGILTNNPDFISAGRRHLDWSLSQQQENGWFSHASFHAHMPPYTHTLAYTAEGLFYSGVLLQEPSYIQAALKLVVACQHVCERRGFFLPARLDKNFKSMDTFSCLTGNAQFAILWLKLGHYTQDLTLINTGLKMVEWLKRVQSLKSKNLGIRGGIAGDWPIFGSYSAFRYLNWATKFSADALMLSIKIKDNTYEKPLQSGSYRHVRHAAIAAV